MTDNQSMQQVMANKPDVPLHIRIFGGIFSAAVSSFFLTWCSLHGIDFKTLGVDSEGIKAAITGAITGVAVAPESVPIALAAFILYWRKAWRIVFKAATENLPEDGGNQ